MAQTEAEDFVDATTVFRILGDEAANYSITSESIRDMLVDVQTEQLARGPYSKFIMFRDKSMAAQVRGSRRWEVDR